MSYFVMIEREEAGCPVGLIDGVVYDRYVSNIKNLDYGAMPWYDPWSAEKEKVFAEKMFLILNQRIIDYDIRSNGSNAPFNIVSEKFLDLIYEFNIPTKEVCPLEIVNIKGVPIANGKYFIIRFSNEIYLDKDKVINEASLLRFDKHKRRFMLLNPLFNDGVELEFFKLKNSDFFQDPIFCGKEFYKRAMGENLKGIDLVSVTDINWPGRMPPLIFSH